MRDVGAIIVVILLLGSGLPCHFIGPSVGQSGQNTVFQFYWNITGEENIFLNGTNHTFQLVIKPVGPPFRANITFKCPETFICPVKNINNIEIIPGKKIDVNFTFTAILNISMILETEIVASLSNMTVSVNFEAILSVQVIFPVSLEYISNYFTKENRSNSLNYLSYHWGITNISNRVKITNYDNKETLKGYLGASSTNWGDKMGSETYGIFNNTLITLPPLKSIIIDLDVPKSDSRFWTQTEVKFIFSPDKNEANTGRIWFFNGTKDHPYYTKQITVFYTIHRSVAGFLGSPSNDFPAYGDIWNGTNLTVTVFNGKTTRLNGIYMDILDIIGQYTAFDYASYSNRTTVYIGDIKPNEWKKVNVTVYSKASGWHMICLVEHGGNCEGNDMDLHRPIYVNSGIGVTFLGEHAIGSVKINTTIYAKILRKTVEKGIETTLTMQIDNPNGYVGDISLSIYETGWDNELSAHHGNGWIDQEIFAQITPKSIRIQGPREIVTFKIVPKTTGTLYIIPHIMVNGRMLLFDHNTELQMWMDSCNGEYAIPFLPDQSSPSRTIPTICTGYSYDNRRLTIVKIEGEFVAMAIISIIVSFVISGIDIYRRYKQEKGYLRKSSSKRVIGSKKIRKNAPKKRPRGQ